MFKYTLLLLIAFVTSCYCVSYKACSTISNKVDRCECYIRSETDYYSDEKQCANIDSAKTIVRNLCKTISYCTDAYAEDDDWCPKATFNYDTSSCRVACLTAIQRELYNHHTGMCLYSKVKHTGWYCNTRGWSAGNFHCPRGWRKEN